MDTSLQVSAVIPVYNDSEYLSGAIDSILCQTYNNIDVIVVDDGSDDDIEPIRQKYGSNSNILFVSHNENKGLPAARNTGINESTGDLIAFLDADDRWTPEKIEGQLKIYNQNRELGMIYTDFYRV
jgi:glycosyltransferase involved in cell wall biosynthesis